MSYLTPDQQRDCYKAGRSPKTGRRFRSTPTSPLENKCKRTNWAKLTVKGAAIAMVKAIKEMNLTYPDQLELEQQIRKMETKMLNQLTAGYEAYRFEYWQHEAKKSAK